MKKKLAGTITGKDTSAKWTNKTKWGLSEWVAVIGIIIILTVYIVDFFVFGPDWIPMQSWVKKHK